MTFRTSGKIVVYRNGSLPSAVRCARRQLLKSRQILDYLSLIYSAPSLPSLSLLASEPLRDSDYFSCFSCLWSVLEDSFISRANNLRRIKRRPSPEREITTTSEWRENAREIELNCNGKVSFFQRWAFETRIQLCVCVGSTLVQSMGEKLQYFYLNEFRGAFGTRQEELLFSFCTDEI